MSLFARAAGSLMLRSVGRMERGLVRAKKHGTEGGTGAPLRRGLLLAISRPHLPAMPFPTMPDPAGDREREQARWHPAGRFAVCGGR